LWRPLSLEVLGNCPVCPPPLNTALAEKLEGTSLFVRTHRFPFPSRSLPSVLVHGRQFAWPTVTKRRAQQTRSSTADDSATGCGRQNLVNCRNKSTNRDMELQGYSWSTCSKQPRLVDCCIGVVNKLDRRRRRRVMLTEIRGEFLSTEFGTVPEGSTLILGRYPSLLTATEQCGIGGRKSPCQKAVRFVQSFRYRLVTERRTDRRTRDNSIYRASIASRGKNQNQSQKLEGTERKWSPRLQVGRDASNEVGCDYAQDRRRWCLDWGATLRSPAE